MRVTSAVHGPFDPLHPDPIEGWFAHVLHTPATDIAAPPARVWQVLTDFEAYPAWCPFTRKIETDGVVGHDVRLHLNWNPRELGDPSEVQVEQVAFWEPEYAVGWGVTMFGGLLRAERTQVLQPHEGGTRYQTYNRFAGVLTPVVRAVYAAKIVAGFTALGDALKQRVEDGEHVQAVR